MEPAHHEFVVDIAPDAVDRVFLISSFAGGQEEAAGVADPIGGSLEAYRRTTHELDAHLRRLLPEVVRRAAAAHVEERGRPAAGPEVAGPGRS
jgi:protein-tyrosine-phosphatase